MTEEMIKNLIEKKGFKRWIKGDKDRLYIKAYELPFVKTKSQLLNVRLLVGLLRFAKINIARLVKFG